MLPLCSWLQYNTCFWALVKSGKSPTEAQAMLKVSLLAGLVVECPQACLLLEADWASSSWLTSVPLNCNIRASHKLSAVTSPLLHCCCVRTL